MAGLYCKMNAYIVPGRKFKSLSSAWFQWNDQKGYKPQPQQQRGKKKREREFKHGIGDFVAMMF